ncbi:uncharacterized protein LOC127809325 [Diospyros lotus]|uniref:uncharacterized protein LOC127809325 n=1 Tax=Diospyros lotus TaxID=55363 RepID=UPI002253DB28|nr:uncharacterized protein LOC127809325 [Diospyros lotus]
MGDGWTDARQKSLINFLVYCSKGLSFINSVDASNFITDAETLGNLFAEIVEFVGPSNVVHMVTNNGANYKATGRKLSERYPTIRWSPCAAHCINLIMKDMSEMNDVKNVATLASKVIVFIYNHKWTLNWLRMRPSWKEIVRPGATHFSTTFIALKSLHDHKDHLQALVVSYGYKKFLKMPKGKEVKQIVLDKRFWNNSLIFVRIMTPLIRLLHRCDSDEKPSLGSKVDKRSYDPVDYESIDMTEFWILEENEEGKLDIDELEDMIEEHPKNDEDNEEAEFMVLDEDSEDGRGGASLEEDENKEKDWLQSPL